jgi:altronate dehydratase large subunit
MSKSFCGFKRKDGQVGIRNKILVVSVDECCFGIANKIANEIENSALVVNHHTCMHGGNEEMVEIIKSICKNPNVYGVVLISMGCGSINAKNIADEIGITGKNAVHLEVFSCGGTLKTIEKGKKLAKEFLMESKKEERVICDISELVVGVKCGGSDMSSGLASNPSVGNAVDRLIDMGATVVVGELFEILGCEEQLFKRCETNEIKNKLDRLTREEIQRWSIKGVEVETMSVGNYAGGLSTIEEKSLGALSKSGTKPICGVLEFNKNGYERPEKPGLYFSDVSMICGGAGAQFSAIGAQVIIWTTGAAGFNTDVVPAITVGGNIDLITEDQDIDATEIMNGNKNSGEVGNEIIEYLLKVASGQKTKVEDSGSSFMILQQKDQKLEYLLKQCNVI